MGKRSGWLRSRRWPLFCCTFAAFELRHKIRLDLRQSAKTAEQQFKNIQVLKDIPADQLIPTMQFIAASLGVECEFCHVEHEMQKDDKKTKVTARKMITMELAINKNHFDNEIDVTCYTCHRGTPHPVGTPILSAEATRPAPPKNEEAAETKPNLPSADEILNKYLAAVGGAVHS